MVAIAVLIGLMGIIAMVFSSASKASGQAQASTALYRVVEQVAETIRQDLESINPSESVLGIARVDVLAYATPEDRETQRLATAGNATLNDWHRADVLMIVSKRKFEPYIFPPPPTTLLEPPDTFEAYRQVVYGHANFGRLDPSNPGTWISQTQVEPALVGEPSPIPASKWHLTRRVVGSPDSNTIAKPSFATRTTLTSPGWASWPLVNNAVANAHTFTGNKADPTQYADLFVDTTLIPSLTFSSLLDSSTYRIAPGTAEYNNSGALVSFFRREGGSVLWYVPSTNKWYCLREDAGDPRPYWWELGPAGPPWIRQAYNPVSGSVQPIPASFTIPAPTDLPLDTPNNTRNWLEWFYRPSLQGIDRTRIDPNPPPGRTDRMAAYLLPGCSDFKIEFTYDDPREIAVDAATGNPSLAPDLDGDGIPDYDIDGKSFPDYDGNGVPDELFTPAPQAIRWQSLDGPQPLSGKMPWTQVQVWNRIGVEDADYGAYKDAAGNPLDLRDLTLQSADPPLPTATVRPTFRWPRAIRITLRVWDPAGRLEDPIVHTIVHTFE